MLKNITKVTKVYNLLSAASSECMAMPKTCHWQLLTNAWR